jgi:hypothetical protein
VRKLTINMVKAELGDSDSFVATIAAEWNH